MKMAQAGPVFQIKLEACLMYFILVNALGKVILVYLQFFKIVQLQIFLEMFDTIRSPNATEIALSLMKLTSCLERALGGVSAKILHFAKP